MAHRHALVLALALILILNLVLAAAPVRVSSPARAEVAHDRAQPPPPVDHCPALPAPTGDVVTVADDEGLQAAVADLEPGVTVLLADGTYDLSSTLHLTGGLTDVALRGASGDPEAVVLRGRGMTNADYGTVPHGVLVSDAQDVLIADLTIRDVYLHAVQVQGEQGARGVQLYNVRLIDAGEQLVKGSSAGPPGPYPDDGLVACSTLAYTERARSWYTNGVDVLAGAGWVVRDNVFRNIRAPAGELAGPAVLFWRNAQDTVVERNRFVNCDRAIALGLSAPDPELAREGEATYEHQGGIVRNNTIYRAPDEDGDVGISLNYARGFKVYHNTVFQSGTYLQAAIEYRFAPTDGDIRYNLTDASIWQRDSGRATTVGNVTGAEPSWFVNVAAGDLHLHPDALDAINRAAPLPEVSEDIDGDPRPISVAPDVGADEFGGFRPSPTPTSSPTPTVSPTPSATMTPAPTLAPTLPPPVTAAPTASPTRAPPATPTGSPTVMATVTSTVTAAASGTSTPSPTPSVTASSTHSPASATPPPHGPIYVPIGYR